MRHLRIAAVFCCLAALTGCSLYAPDPMFTADPLSGDAPLEVTFTDTSKVRGPLGVVWDIYFPVTGWEWDFGDGGGSTTQNPVHTFTEAGAYSVSLSARNSMGSQTTTETNLITVTAGGPVADFTASELNGPKPLEVTFTDISDPAGSPITDWLWDFGDGGASTDQSPTHVFNESGTYTVSLTVTNGVGSDTEIQEDLITVDVGRPTVRFIGDPRSGPAPLTVTFTDLSSPGDLDITSWTWNFGDGIGNNNQNPTHTYSAPGVYDVRLTARNALGQSVLTENDYITVQGPPLASFDSEADDTNPLLVRFTDTTDDQESEITTWAWDFGDGGSSDLQNPAYTYGTAGDYTVELTVTNDIGTDTVTVVVTVGS